MKGFLNKVKTQVKEIIKSPQKEEKPEKTTKKYTDLSLRDFISEEFQNLRKGGFLLNKKVNPKTKQEIIKGCLNSQKGYQLYQCLSQEAPKNEEMTQIDLNVYCKNPYQPTSLSLQNIIKEQGKIDVCSEEIFNLLNRSQAVIINEETPLLCLSVIGFHHEKGAIVIFLSTRVY